MDSLFILSYSILSPSGAYFHSFDYRKMEDNWRTERFLSAGGAKLEIAALFKPWAFQAYLGTDDGANKHRNQSS